jgi:hypothetical protein
MPPSENPWTQRLWIYDFRTNPAPGDEWRDEGTTSEYASQYMNYACPRRTQIGRRVSSNACQMAQAASWRTRPLLHFRSAAELPVSTAGKYTHGGFRCQCRCPGRLIWPGDLGVVTGLGVVLCWGVFPRWLRGLWLPRWPGSSWSARSRVAARTNELDWGQRRPVIGAGEGRWGGVVSRVCVVGGVVSHAPVRRWPWGWLAAMTVTSGDWAAQSATCARRWCRLMCFAGLPGAWRPSRLVSVGVGWRLGR